MGVLNATPDSFSDGGRDGSVSAAVERALGMVADGADIVDVGGESTRPGAASVTAEEQIRRVVPVIAGLRAASPVAISVDTTSAQVAAAALDAGADIVNDISAFRFDAAMLPLIAERGVPAIAMHTLGRPAVMQQAPSYIDVVDDVLAHLASRVEAAVSAGVDRHQLIIDPGIGFGKTVAHNLALLHATRQFCGLGLAVLVGVSRKRFLGELTGRDVTERLAATCAANAVAIAGGASIIRVHDVAEARDVSRIAAAIAGAGSP